MQSFITHWEAMAERQTPTGSTRPGFKLPTGTLKQLTCHATTLNPGERAHAPHQHPEEEMILLKEGTLEAIHNGRTEQFNAGSVFVIAPEDLHGVKNVGTGPATYYVIKWFTE